MKRGQRRAANSLWHLKASPGREGPSIALYSLAAEHTETPSTSVEVNNQMAIANIFHILILVS